MSGNPRHAAFRAEVLRWNASINLVSRRHTEERLDALLAQCDDALAVWRQAADPLGLALAGRDVLYLDVGSGGGVPAMIWHERLAAEVASLRTVLVEPREKRAWFLERVARNAASPAPEVLACRWGETSPAATSPDLVIVSLKALRLVDARITAGLAPFLARGAAPDLAVARFHPQDKTWSGALASSLGIPSPGARSEGRGWGAEAVAAGLVTAKEASLVVSRYRFQRL